MKRLVLDFGRPARRHERFAHALEIAKTFAAELRCVYAVPPLRFIAPSMSATLSEEEVRALLNEPAKQLERAQSEFDALSFNCPVATSWHESTQPPQEIVIEQARYADLALVEKPTADGLSDRDVFDIVTGCPGGVLVLPETGTSGVGLTTVLVAWNGSREAARALHEAMPFLARAERVVIVSADEAPFHPHDATATTRLLDLLAVHGIAARTHTVEAKPQDMGLALLDAAGAVGAGLLVMGAFGHSRTFEYWLGGATRDALKETSVPLLMAH